MLYKLAHEGEAPKTFGHVSKRIVPSHAIIGITSGIFIGFMLNVLAQFLNKSLANVFVIVYSSSVLPGMVAWFVILLAELRFRRKNPHLMENHPFKLPRAVIESQNRLRADTNTHAKRQNNHMQF